MTRRCSPRPGTGHTYLRPLSRCLLTLLIALSGEPAGAQETPALLESGRAVERNLAGGESHLYQILLSTDQFLCVSAEQRGVDLTIRIFAGDGQKLIEMDTLNSTQGPEVAAILAPQNGLYRIEIVSTNTAAPPGR